MADAWELIYWHFLPGRGDFVRLIFEEAGVAYDDVCKREGNSNTAMKYYKGENDGFPVIAPPIIRKGSFVLNQSTAILSYLGKEFGLFPGGGAEEEAHALQMALSACDYISEGRECFHPVEKHGSYDMQKEEAKPFIGKFKKDRIPK